MHILFSFRPALKQILLLGFALGITVGCSHLMDADKSREKARIYLRLAADNFQKRDFNQSIENALEAIRLDPEFAAAYNHLGIVYMETKRFGRSEEAFQKALDLEPSYSDVENNFGVMLNRQERFKEALPHFEKAVNDIHYSTPENAFTNMGYAYFRMGNHSKAKFFHQKALDIVPQFCLANKNLGDVYTKEHNYKKASELFDKATTTCPFYEESRYKLGLALMKLGHKDIAKAQLEKLIERHKSGPYVERSQEVLKLLH